MNNEKIYKMPFSKIYPMYLAKTEKKGRTKREVDEIIYWLTGYDESTFTKQIDGDVNIEAFFNEAPNFNEKAILITGVICGVRIEEIAEPLMKKIRYLDKLIDELAKGRSMEKILRK
ncbi:MAG: DUF2200 domain-containing protein [Candidatus Izemoplasmatales bacterium]|nr:DUF2200 domain-containing protein [Candidatus Izemoplasmatales bacterium]